MKIFDVTDVICVSCRRRIRREHMKIVKNGIGICEKCMQKLSPLPPDSPLEGTHHIAYMFSAYYYNDSLKKLIHRYKFGGEYKLSELFCAMLADYLKNIESIAEFDFITAVPLSHKRFLSRGFNQAELLAKGVGEILNIPYVQCVYRSKNTTAQSTLKRHDRIHNISNAFIADRSRVENKRILLADDIITTGSTVESCAQELIKKGAELVVSVSLAKTK